MSAFARTASRQLRGSDRIFLDEGRTLIALLPHAEVEGAMKAAERMADAVRVADARIGSARIDLLTSAGVAALEPSDADGQSLLNRARAALREAGRSGEALVYASGAPLATPWQRAARRLFGGGSTEWVPQIARAS
jgi:GGDEF domain-containing protein